MERLIKELDENLKMLETKYDDEIIELHVEYGNEKISVCPKCGGSSARVHSRHTTYAWDLPIQNHKVKLIFHVKELFCDNEKCPQKIFVERFDFLGNTKKRTKRLEKYILDVSKSSSAMQTERLMRDSVAEISNDTIMRLVKKKKKHLKSIAV